MFSRIKNYFIKKMYKSCSEELNLIRAFYRKNVLLDPCQFSDLPSEKRFQIYEEEVLVHIPFDAYKIYKKMFGTGFQVHLMLDAFGYSDFKYGVVEDLFMEKCRNAERK